jgi:hypothetical protein
MSNWIICHRCDGRYSSALLIETSPFALSPKVRRFVHVMQWTGHHTYLLHTATEVQGKLFTK